MNTLFWIAVTLIATPMVIFMLILLIGMFSYIVEEWCDYDTEEKLFVSGGLSMLFGLILLCINVMLS